MPCARGCCPTQAEHYKSLHVTNKDALAAGKTTVDRHDRHTVTVHESGDRQDVTVKVPTIKATTAVREEF